MMLLGRFKADSYAPRWQTIAVAGLYAFSAIAFGLLVVFLVQWRDAVDDGEAFQKESAQARARTAAGAMTSELNEFAASVRDFAGELELLTDPGKGVTGRLDDFISGKRNAMRAGVLFTPVDGERFAPFSSHRPDPLDPLILERGSEKFDYTAPSASPADGLDNPERYLRPFADGAAWARPYYDPIFETVVVEYGVRFPGSPDSDSGGANGGVLYAQISIDRVIGNVSWNAFRESGYGLIVSGDGLYLAHPLDERVLDQVDASLTGVLADGFLGASGVVEYEDDLGGGSAWLAIEPVAPVGWALGHVVFRDLVVGRTADTQSALMRSTAAAIAALVIIVTILSRAYAGNLRGLWITSLAMSVMLIAGLGYFWFLEMDTPERRPPNQLSAETISAFEDAVFDEFGFFANRALAGATIESVTFVTVDTAIVTGRIWQKLDNIPVTGEEGAGGAVVIEETALPILRKSFLFPQDVKFQRLFGSEQGLNGQFGWVYEAVMTVDFDFGKYPFDRTIVSVPLEQSDFGRAVISVPDLESYDELIPDQRPGLRSNLSIVGWTPETAFFDYEAVDFKNDLGLLQPIGTRSQPALSYNLRMSRVIVGPLITNILPLGIVIALLFTVMMMSARMNLWIMSVAGNVRGSSQSIVETPTGRVGGWPSYSLIAVAVVVAYSGALLFTVISAHARLRSQFPEAGLLYLEFFYFIAYLAVFAVAVNALAFASHRVSVVQYRENLLPRVAFWPFITGYLFITAFVTFH